jgi:murein DD-endopeptidase MepM/ murein hydrolase activator NlpD
VDEFNLKIGMNLDLTVSKPALTVSTVEKVTENIVIEPLTEIRTDPSMRAGQTKVVREGKSGLKQMSYMLTKHNGDLVIEQWLGQKVITPAVSKIIVRGTKVVVGEGSGNFAWPVSSASISSPYGTRWGRMHKGIDITGSHNVKASDDGVVSFAGTKSGYGNVIIINHKNGYETLYGHLDSFKVKKGAVVEKGQAIAVMGNTGRSTGTHLHFEIHKNGSLRNPMSFL